MPFVNVKLEGGVFAEAEKHAMAAALTDVMVSFEGSETWDETLLLLQRSLRWPRRARRHAYIPFWCGSDGMSIDWDMPPDRRI
jgi:hypothetical protein